MHFIAAHEQDSCHPAHAEFGADERPIAADMRSACEMVANPQRRLPDGRG